jgi:hypothetical protein
MSESKALLFLRKVVAKKVATQALDVSRESAKMYKIIYTGKNQKDILKHYRILESDNQKDQRYRISINRTKALVGTIENVLDQLNLMDTPAINILKEEQKEDDKEIKDVENFIYENDIKDLAFKLTKYHNLVDPDAFVTARINEYDDFIFEVVSSSNVEAIYKANNIVKYVVFKFRSVSKIGTDLIDEYELFSKDEIIKAKVRGTDIISIEAKPTRCMLAYRLGYLLNPETNFETCVSILDAASELFKGLIYTSSDLDVDLATHGIIKRSEYAPTCKFTASTAQGQTKCVSGYLHHSDGNTGVKCPSCKGSGLKIHTSSQDISVYPLPDRAKMDELPKLSDMSYTTTVPNTVFEYRQKHVDKLKEEIVEAVFNRSIVTKSEVPMTATEVSVDLQGIYATLNALGLQVSNVFIFMVEAYALEYRGYENIKALHAYRLNLKLETVESLVDLRAKLIAANAPIEMIKAVDLAILQKQNADNPGYIEKFSIWEKYRPFSDKSEQAIAGILAGLPETSRYKITYNFWGQIKASILDKYKDGFFKLSHELKQKAIDEQVDLIIAQIKAETEPIAIDKPVFE